MLLAVVIAGADAMTIKILSFITNWINVGTGKLCSKSVVPVSFCLSTVSAISSFLNYKSSQTSYPPTLIISDHFIPANKVSDLKNFGPCTLDQINGY